MPLTVQYALLASACPAVRVPSALLDPSAADPTPLVSRTFVTGVLAAQMLNELSVRIDNLARYGGGGILIAEGLDLTEGTGLQGAVSAGTGQSDGHQVKTAARTVALTASVQNYVYQLQSGALSVVASSTTPPAASAVYLGRLTTDGSGVTVVDRSGVLYGRRAMPWRRTGDATAPSDTPPASMALLTKTVSGLYLWDGTAHVQIG